MEVARLVELGRLVLPEPPDRWLAAAASPRTVRILPVTPEIAIEVSRLPVTFHRAPAERLIVATSRVAGLPLVTRDRTNRGSHLIAPWAPDRWI